MAAPSHSPTAKPWYRYGWVWFLIGIPMSAVVAGFITLYIAITTADSLVADDYYKEGRAINQRLEKDQEAMRLGVSLKTEPLKQSEGWLEIRVQFQANPGVTAPQTITLRMTHPTLNHLDVTATLQKTAANTYQTRVPRISPGRWHVQLQDSESAWRIKSIWTVE